MSQKRPSPTSSRARLSAVQSIASRIVYHNSWMTVREDRVRWPDGSVGVYGVVEKPDFALVLPRDQNGFWMVEQYRYPVGRRAWEFPHGTWSDGNTGSPMDLARAELTEETGLTAKTFTRLGHLKVAYGFSSQGCDVFLATGLSGGEPRRETTESDMVHRFVSDDELLQMVKTGTLVDAPSLAALALYRHINTDVRAT
jgi:8-oxo-dGTP pyrophosphatase MutT (NUDIX family)